MYENYVPINHSLFDKKPEGWKLFKLKFLINTLESGKRKDFENTDYAFSIGGEHIEWNGSLNLTNERYLSEEFYKSMNKGKIDKNDVLLVKDGATIGKTAFVDKLTQKMAVNEHVFILRNNNRVIPKLLYYLIISNLGFTQIKLTETGSAQGGISQEIVDKIEFIIPLDLNEQKQIVDYLDKEITRIDNNIAKNNELISLLEEKRISLINQVVTKGLNQEATMKYSGIEWIGDIPDNWNMMKISNMFNNIGSGTTPKSSNEEYYTDGTVNWLITGDLNDDYIYETSTQINIKAFHDTSLKMYPKDSLVIAMYGATIGKLGILKVEACTNQACCVLSKPNGIINKYAYYWLLGYRKDIVSLSYGGGQPNISQDIIKNLKISIPPLEEQNQIVNYLDIEITNINNIINKINENISLLNEYKTSLIHHTVTGKIDVRSEEI